jgi:hypothetical protein
MNYEKMKMEFNNSPLPPAGIKLPRKGTQAAETLLFLWKYKGKVVTKKDAEAAVCKKMNMQPKDLQSLRHLGKQKGFKILQGGQIYKGSELPRGTYVFEGFEEINEFWNYGRREQKNLDWNSIKIKYEYCCATCGAPEGKRHRYTGHIVVLEKGHKDPLGPMNNKNIIPQCKNCNKIAKNYYIFDNHGRVKSMTNDGILSCCPIQQLRELSEELIKMKKRGKL